MNFCVICQKNVRFYHKKKKYYNCNHVLHTHCFKEFIKCTQSHNNCPSCRSLIKGKHFRNLIWDVDNEKLSLRLGVNNTKRMNREIIASVIDVAFIDFNFRRKFNNCIDNGHILQIYYKYDQLQSTCYSCNLRNTIQYTIN